MMVIIQINGRQSNDICMKGYISEVTEDFKVLSMRNIISMAIETFIFPAHIYPPRYNWTSPGPPTLYTKHALLSFFLLSNIKISQKGNSSTSGSLSSLSYSLLFSLILSHSLYSHQKSRKKETPARAVPR